MKIEIKKISDKEMTPRLWFERLTTDARNDNFSRMVIECADRKETGEVLRFLREHTDVKWIGDRKESVLSEHFLGIYSVKLFLYLITGQLTHGSRYSGSTDFKDLRVQGKIFINAKKLKS